MCVSRTQRFDIVELSRRDTFWGAVPDANGATLIGCNNLGLLLMDLRSGHGLMTPTPPNVNLIERKISE